MVKERGLSGARHKHTKEKRKISQTKVHVQAISLDAQKSDEGCTPSVECLEVIWDSPKCTSKNQSVKDKTALAMASFFATEAKETYSTKTNSSLIMFSPPPSTTQSSPAIKLKYASPSQTVNVKHFTPIRYASRVNGHSKEHQNKYINMKVKSVFKEHISEDDYNMYPKDCKMPLMQSDGSLHLNLETSKNCDDSVCNVKHCGNEEKFNSNNKRTRVSDVSTHTTDLEEGKDNQDGNWDDDSFFNESTLEATQKIVDNFILVSSQPGDKILINKTTPHKFIRPLCSPNSANKGFKTKYKFKNVKKRPHLQLNTLSESKEFEGSNAPPAPCFKQYLPTTKTACSTANLQSTDHVISKGHVTSSDQSVFLKLVANELFNNTLEESEMVALLDLIEEQESPAATKDDSLRHSKTLRNEIKSSNSSPVDHLHLKLTSLLIPTTKSCCSNTDVSQHNPIRPSPGNACSKKHIPIDNSANRVSVPDTCHTNNKSRPHQRLIHTTSLNLSNHKNLRGLDICPSTLPHKSLMNVQTLASNGGSKSNVLSKPSNATKFSRKSLSSDNISCHVHSLGINQSPNMEQVEFKGIKSRCTLEEIERKRKEAVKRLAGRSQATPQK